jgi:hypothetical protein
MPGSSGIDQSQAVGTACSLTSQVLTPNQSCNVAVVFVPSNIGDMAANVLVQVGTKEIEWNKYREGSGSNEKGRSLRGLFRLPV